MELKTNATDRKALVNALAEITGAEAKYMGPPSFSYTVDYYTVNRNCAVSFDDSADSEEVERLIEGLAERGFIDKEEKADELRIKVPMDTGDARWTRNLIFTLHAHQYLLNKVTRQNSFSISDSLVETLSENPVGENSPLRSTLFGDGGDWKGVAFGPGEVEFTFPVSEDPNKNRAYAELAAFMVSSAKRAERLPYAEQTPENEKYYLRSWLLRLGLTGEGGKASRKALLAGLTGHTAFRTPADAEKHKTRLAARKAAQAQRREPAEE